MLGSSSTMSTLDIAGYARRSSRAIRRSTSAHQRRDVSPDWGTSTLGQQFRREALPLRDALDLHGNRVDRLLHALQSRADVARRSCRFTAALDLLRIGARE